MKIFKSPLSAIISFKLIDSSFTSSFMPKFSSVSLFFYFILFWVKYSQPISISLLDKNKLLSSSEIISLSESFEIDSSFSRSKLFIFLFSDCKKFLSSSFSKFIYSSIDNFFYNINLYITCHYTNCII